jgi:PKD repeat protein
VLKKVASATVIALLLLGIALTSIPTGTGQETRIIKIVNVQENSNSISLGSGITQLPIGGYPFTVNVTLDGTTNGLFTYQVAVAFNRTKVRCSGAWINMDDPNWVFYSNRGVSIVINASIDNDEGNVYLGASLIEGYSANVQGGLLCQINFTAIATGNSTLQVLPTGGTPDTFLWDTNQIEMSFTGENFNVTTFAGPTPPVASFFFSPPNPMANQTVTFYASESYDPNGDTLQYVWNFGDGFSETYNVTIALHNYTLNGPYSVNLTVVENVTSQHLSNSIVLEIQVGQIPHATFTYAPTDINPFELVTFDAAASYDPDGVIVSYLWNFADGNVTGPSNNPVITHAFSAKGVYPVDLTVRDNDNLHGSFAQDVFVGRPPIANFTYSPSDPKVLQVVTFDASQSHAADTGDYIAAYVWNFDDYNTTTVNSTASNPWVVKHVYLTRDEYQVNLTVYDNNGLYSSTVQKVTVTQPQKSPDYTLYIIAGIIAAVIVIAVVVTERKKPKSKHRPKATSSKTQSRS